MEYLDQDTSNCSVGRAVGLVGQSWVLLILRDVTRGIRRFSDLQDHLGVSRSVLADRLGGLVSHGLLELHTYQEPGARRRAEYVLTDKGRDLYPLLTSLRQWGDKYLADPEGPALLATHHDCGAPVRARLVCDEGHVIGAPEEVDRTPGPSARPRPAAGATA
ncbi:winged helix-turn-helix transcriptional regulator [Streptomyces sp. NPDC058864]